MDRRSPVTCFDRIESLNRFGHREDLKERNSAVLPPELREIGGILQILFETGTGESVSRESFCTSSENPQIALTIGETED